MSGCNVSAMLTVYFDGQFWVALYEREDEAGLAAARHVFGPEPSLPEIAELMRDPVWSGLNFVVVGAGDDRDSKPASNPKRRQREAAQQTHGNGTSTKAQETLRLALGELAKESRASGRKRSLAEEAERRRRQVAKRKQKKRGR